MTIILQFLKSAILWVFKNPTLVLCLVVAGVVAWLYVNNVNLKAEITEQDIQIEELKSDLRGYKKTLEGVQEAIKERDEAYRKVQVVLSKHSKDIAALRVKFDPKSLQKILETQGKQALEDYINAELQKRLKCLEGGCDG